MGGGQVKDCEPNKPKRTPEITGTIDRDKYNRTVINPYEHGVLTSIVCHRPTEAIPRLTAQHDKVHILARQRQV